MKRLVLILLSLVMSVSAFACKGEGDVSSNVSTPDKVESSSAVSDDESSAIPDDSSAGESSLPDESSEPENNEPQIDMSKVLFNPDEAHYGFNELESTLPNFGGEFDATVLHLFERGHLGLVDYITSNEVSSDNWFCIRFCPNWVRTESGETYMFDELPQYLATVGIVADATATEEFINNGEIDSAIIGYATKDMLWKIRTDGYSGVIEIAWLPEICFEHKQCW